MNRRKAFFAGAAALVLAAWPAISATRSDGPPSPAEDGTLKALAAIAGAGTMEDDAYTYLEELSDNIGGRVTGSPEAARAIAWGAEKMKAIGLENVRTETWQLFRGWTRGLAEAEITSPIHRKLMIDSLGWVGSTPEGGVDASVLPVNAFDIENEMKHNAGNWRGTVLLVVHKGKPPADFMVAFAKFGDFLKAAHQAGAVAVIAGQGGGPSAGMHLTHTGVMGFDAAFEIPVVSMAAEDQGQLERFVERGEPLRLHINVQNQFTNGPVESANVIGEIRGSTNPEQVVVVGGHLDSWDLASGTTDNGCGTTTTLGAAEAIVKSGYKPRRTIRFVLFTGEEQGLDGSLNYTKTHKDEMANHVAAVILDNGQGPVTGFDLGGRGDLIPSVEKFASSLGAFGKMTVDDETEFGTDTGPFILAGLPGINLKQNSPDYKYTHHSPVDTFDKVDRDVLDRDATVMALTAFWIADRPERLASPWPAEKTARMLMGKHDDVMLKAFGLWPFGNLGTSAE